MCICKTYLSMMIYLIIYGTFSWNLCYVYFNALRKKNNYSEDITKEYFIISIIIIELQELFGVIKK